jgi:hypothetical protein
MTLAARVFFLTFVHQKIEKENTCLQPPLLSLDPREKGMRKLRSL